MSFAEISDYEYLMEELVSLTPLGNQGFWWQEIITRTWAIILLGHKKNPVLWAQPTQIFQFIVFPKSCKISRF